MIYVQNSVLSTLIIALLDFVTCVPMPNICKNKLVFDLPIVDLLKKLREVFIAKFN